jgi:O-acetylserine/cysteine efflux transporter
MKPLHLLLTLFLVLIWGFNFVVMKVGMNEIPPIFLAFSRFFLTSVPAVFFIKRPNAPFKMIVLYGLVMFALPFALLFTGMSFGIAAGLASVLFCVQIFFALLLAFFFLGEKAHPRQIIGATISFSGIAFVAMHLGGDITLSGFFLVILAAAFWGGGSVVSKKIGNVNMISLVTWGSLVAWPPLLFLSLILEGGDTILYTLNHLSGLSITAVLYITYASTLFGFGVWGFLLNRYPVGLISPFTLLGPIIAILGSVLLLGEPFGSWKIFAAFLVILGLCINLLSLQPATQKS